LATLDPAEELNKWVSGEPSAQLNEEDKEAQKPKEHDYLKQAKGNTIDRLIR
jgi:hypothetical protein